MRYIETICICDGHPLLLPLHIRRMQRTAREKGFALPPLPDLAHLCPSALTSGTTKCRLLYNVEGIAEIDFTPYIPREINSLRIIEAPSELDYHLKYADRSALHRLLDQRGEADDVLIIRDGLLTDTSYTNLILRFGEQLLTPRRPLLEGVQRQHLLQAGIVHQADLRMEDLQRSDEILLINAMLPLERAIRIQPSRAIR